ncbi:MAG: biotin transporter BioY [Clostridia bacterium]|nr:biotin transporter BioY [Clostridia bacterium]
MNRKTNKMTLYAFGAVLMTVCAWITLPFVIPFTMQTFALYFLLYYLGARGALVSVVLYICLGLVGLPVFSGFTHGVQLAGPTGGFVFGFLLAILVYWLLESLIPEFKLKRYLCSVLSLICCYVLGAVWVCAWAQEGFLAIVAAYILPYVIPDLLKIYLADIISKRMKKIKA